MTIKTLLESAQNSLASFPAFPLREGPKSAQSGSAFTLPTLYSGLICLCNQGRRSADVHVCRCVSPSCSTHHLPGRTAHLNGVLTPLACIAVGAVRVVVRAMWHACVPPVACAAVLRATARTGGERREESVVCARASRARSDPRHGTGLHRVESSGQGFFHAPLLKEGH